MKKSDFVEGARFRGPNSTEIFTLMPGAHGPVVANRAGEYVASIEKMNGRLRWFFMHMGTLVDLPLKVQDYQIVEPENKLTHV